MDFHWCFVICRPRPEQTWKHLYKDDRRFEGTFFCLFRVGRGSGTGLKAKGPGCSHQDPLRVCDFGLGLTDEGFEIEVNRREFGFACKG